MHASMYKRFHLNISLNLSSPWYSSKKMQPNVAFLLSLFFFGRKKEYFAFYNMDYMQK